MAQVTLMNCWLLQEPKFRSGFIQASIQLSSTTHVMFMNYYSHPTFVLSPKYAANLKPTVTLRLDKDPNIYFTVPEDLLRAASPFFENALSGPRTELQERTISFQTEDCTTINSYVHWLYRETLPEVLGIPTPEDLDLAKAYVFGAKVLDPKFQNKVIDAMVTRIGELNANSRRGVVCFAASVIDYLYQHTDDGAPIRAMLVDMWTDKMPPAFIEGIA
ncbi:hypothetical protein BJY00DRAFT_61509 [Aspergillus carlsbadensis]|nr:hypothetical protein BJY00DRAFT_61509 [Aspergillus carlsbadensis]